MSLSPIATAHAAGIVHHGLKPASISVTEQGLVEVLDFGLAKLMKNAQGGGSETTLLMSPATIIAGNNPVYPYLNNRKIDNGLRLST